VVCTISRYKQFEFGPKPFEPISVNKTTVTVMTGMHHHCRNIRTETWQSELDQLLSLHAVPTIVMVLYPRPSNIPILHSMINCPEVDGATINSGFEAVPQSCC
jgi:hypothetical protein